jgi:hypothetical protein
MAVPTAPPSPKLAPLRDLDSFATGVRRTVHGWGRARRHTELQLFVFEVALVTLWRDVDFDAHLRPELGDLYG